MSNDLGIDTRIPRRKRIAIMMLTLNSERYLRNGVLDGIDKAFKNYDYELIVIDGGSEDATVDLLRSRFKDRLHLIHCPIRNLAVCRNLALQNASKGFDYVCFVDSDILLPENFLDRLLPLFNDPKVGTAEIRAVLGYPKKTPVSEYYRYVKTAQGAGIQEAIGGATTCIVIRPEVASKIRLDERFRRAGEDVELHLQVNMLGYKTLVDMDEPFAKHIRSPSILEELKRMYHRGMARVLNLKLYNKILNDSVKRGILSAIVTLSSWVFAIVGVSFSFYIATLPLVGVFIRHVFKLTKPYRLDLAFIGLLISTSYLIGFLVGTVKYYIVERLELAFKRTKTISKTCSCCKEWKHWMLR